MLVFIGSGLGSSSRPGMMERCISQDEERASSLSLARQRRTQVRLVVETLEHHAIALGQLEELVDLLLRRIRVDLEGETDIPKAHGRGLVDAERAAEIEVA